MGDEEVNVIGMERKQMNMNELVLSTVNCCCYLRDDLLNQIQTRNRIEVEIYIEATNQDEDDKWKREGKEVTHSCYKKERYILSCRRAVVPYPIRLMVLFTRRTHGKKRKM